MFSQIYDMAHILAYTLTSQVVSTGTGLYSMQSFLYGVATISRLLRMIGLFCRISSLLQGSFAKETYDFEEPTNHSHPIAIERASGGERVCSGHDDVCAYTTSIHMDA